MYFTFRLLKLLLEQNYMRIVWTKLQISLSHRSISWTDTSHRNKTFSFLLVIYADLNELSFFTSSSSTDSPGYTALWHVTSGNLLAKISEDRQVLASAVDSNCTTFCTTGYDCSIRIYNCDSFRHQTSLDKRLSNAK